MHRHFLIPLLVVEAVACDPAPTPIGTIPPPPKAQPTQSSETATFAFDSLLLGDTTDFESAPGSTAWKRFGYNLDGLVTTSSSTDVCTHDAPATSDPSGQEDGLGGIDNAWGAAVVQLIVQATSSTQLSEAVSAQIQAGKWTIQVQVTGLSEDSQQSATGLHAQVFASGPLNESPSFDSATDWPVTPSSLNGATIGSGAVVQLTTAYVNHGVFVGRAGASTSLELPIGLFGNLVIHLRMPIVTFELDKSGSATNGILAGVLDAAELQADLAPWFESAAMLFGPICGPNLAGILHVVRAASDILSDGTNRRGTPCTAISFGAGFTAKRIADPSQVGPPLALPVGECDAHAD